MSLRPSRIDYIVYSNPVGVKRLIYQAGYEPPQTLDRLSKAIKALIRKNGKPVVERLLQLHPDRAFFSQRDSIKKPCECAVCTKQEKQRRSSFHQKMDREELYQQLSELRIALKEQPDNTDIVDQIRLTRTALAIQEQSEPVNKTEGKRSLFKATGDIIVALSLTLLAGIIIGGTLNAKAHG